VIQVSIRYYNIVADLLGKQTERRALPPGTTAQGLIEALARESQPFGRFALTEAGQPRGHLRLFRNAQAVPDLAEVLADGDEIRVFPTISGG
jgi:molybdopterin converting factor small subunit